MHVRHRASRHVGHKVREGRKDIGGETRETQKHIGHNTLEARQQVGFETLKAREQVGHVIYQTDVEDSFIILPLPNLFDENKSYILIDIPICEKNENVRFYLKFPPFHKWKIPYFNKMD